MIPRHHNTVRLGHDRRRPRAADRGVAPRPPATGVAGGSTISVQFSTDLAPGSPMPTLSPAVAGSGRCSPRRCCSIKPPAPLVPGTTETITVPGGPNGVVGSRGPAPGRQRVTTSFTVAQGSTLRLQQMLAELGYLPLNFTPAAPVTSPTQEGDDQVGTLHLALGQPARLADLVVDAGHRQRDHQGCGDELRVAAQPQDRRRGRPAVWARSADRRARAGQGDALPYGYVFVSQDPARDHDRLPERRRSLPHRWPTPGWPPRRRPTGTLPVFARYTVTTMSGTNPDGSKYVDPGIRWVSYFNGGDALHGFPRASLRLPPE